MAGITLKKIAADLDLSLGAVSAALATHSTTKVSAKTAARVRAYAEKVSYRPSLVGKAMRSQCLRQVGILVESDFGQQRRQGSIVEFATIFGLNDFLRDQGWHLNIIDDNGHRTDQTPRPRYLREHFLDGLVVTSHSADRDKVLHEELERFSLPAIFLNAIGEYNCVCINDHWGSSQAARHLIDLGHRNILFVASSSHHYSVSERVRGYREILAAESLEAPIYYLESDEVNEVGTYESRIDRTRKVGRRFVEEIYVKQRPTGIICYDDRIALILMQALHEAGFSVPEDVPIVGFNDALYMDLLPTALTTVRIDFYQMAQLAGQLLLELIQNPKKRLPSPIFKPELVVRRSTRAVTTLPQALG